MPSKSTVTASLPPELTDFIAAKLATGHYRSASEVIRAGLQALDKEEQCCPGRQTEAPDVDLSFLDDSEIGRLARTFDWSRTSIGPIPTWPQSLKTTIGTILRSPVPIVLLWGPDGVMIYNDAYSVVAGGRHPLLFGSKVREGWPEVADFNDNVMKVGLSGGTLSYRNQELTLHRKGVPEQVWMNLDYSPVLDESGQPAGVLAVVVETTERVQAERTLARTEERLSYALNAAGMIGTFDWHIQTDTLYSDARFATMFSVDPQKGATGAPISVYFAGIHPDDRERIAEAVNHVIATREKYTQEYRLLQRDGTIRWIEARGECLYDEQGEPLRFPGTAVDITERKRVESVLRESEVRFRNLADNSPVMVWVTEPDASCTYLSRSWYEFTGQTPETGLGLGWLDATHPDDKAEAERIYLAANERREAFQIEYRLRRADGTYRWAIDAAAPRFSEEGEFLGYVGSVIDITDRKEAEDTLRDSEQRIRELLEALPAAVYTTDAEGRITFYNQAAVELSGRRPVLGSDQWCVSWKLYWPDGTPLPHDQCPMAMSLKQDRPIRGMEAIAERPDGTRVPFIPYPMPLHDASGKLIGAVNMLVDITDRKKAEDALHASEERLRAIFSQTTGGIALGDMTGRFTMVNQRYCDLVGYTEAELTRMRMQDITHPDDLPGNAVLFQRLTETGESFVIEKRYLRKDGSHVWVNNSVAPIRDAAGQVQQVVAVAIEIEALKEAQERQHLLLRELNHRVKNLFAIASGMVALSARSAKTPQEMAQILQGRLNALARANDLIRPGLIGTEADQEATTMEKLVQAVLLPYVDEARARERESIILNGPAVPVAGDAVTSLALVLHETATNAAKYGALSAPEGRIRVDWKVQDSNLYLRWEETDGPVIVEPPQGHGFGSSLVKRSVTGQLQGQIEYDWRNDGLTVHVTVPMERLSQ